MCSNKSKWNDNVIASHPQHDLLNLKHSMSMKTALNEGECEMSWHNVWHDFGYLQISEASRKHPLDKYTHHRFGVGFTRHQLRASKG